MMIVGVNRKSTVSPPLGNAQTNPIQQVCPDISYEKANIWRRRKIEEKNLKVEELTPKYFQPGWKVEAEQPKWSGREPKI